MHDLVVHDPGWADVPDHHLVDVADGVVTVTELEA